MAVQFVTFLKYISTILLIILDLKFSDSRTDRIHPRDVDVDKIMHVYRRYKYVKLFEAETFWMGINDPTSETGEYPMHQATVRSFYIDQYPVTTIAFWEFIMKKPRYLSTAQMNGWSWVFEQFVSNKTKKTMAVKGTGNWLAVRKANWEHPEGPDSDIQDRWSHPVVHVSWHDAKAFCEYFGKRLPTEEEWERAARGTKFAQTLVQYPWGDNWRSNRMNVWQGHFPNKNNKKDGYIGTSPVDAYRTQNDDGMYDMIGNIWEWTTSRFYQHLVPFRDQELQLVLKGGSYLDTSEGNYNYIVRTSQRMSQPPEYSSGNVGFRCAFSAPHMDPIHVHQKYRDLHNQFHERNRLREEL